MSARNSQHDEINSQPRRSPSPITYTSSAINTVIPDDMYWKSEIKNQAKFVEELSNKDKQFLSQQKNLLNSEYSRILLEK